jgi:hypothetical protein
MGRGVETLLWLPSRIAQWHPLSERLAAGALVLFLAARGLASDLAA